MAEMIDTFAPMRNALAGLRESAMTGYNVRRQRMMDEQAQQQNALAGRFKEAQIGDLNQQAAVRQLNILGPIAKRILANPDQYQALTQQASQLISGAPPAPASFEEARPNLEAAAQAYDALNPPAAPEYMISDGQYVPKTPGAGQAMPIPGYQAPEPKPGEQLAALELAARQKQLRGEQLTEAEKEILAGKPSTKVDIYQRPKPPTGYRYTDDGNLEPIPGGPAAGKEEATKKVKEEMSRQAEQKFQTVSTNIDKALGDVGLLTTGFIGKMASAVPGTPAYDLGQTIDTIKANIGFDTLQKMREASPTGGALGQVSERELAQLERVLGSLDIGQSREQIIENLYAIKTHYQNWKDAVTKASGRQPGSDNGTGMAPQNAAFGGVNPNTGKMEYFDAQGNKL